MSYTDKFTGTSPSLPLRLMDFTSKRRTGRIYGLERYYLIMEFLWRINLWVTLLAVLYGTNSLSRIIQASQ